MKYRKEGWTLVASAIYTLRSSTSIEFPAEQMKEHETGVLLVRCLIK